MSEPIHIISLGAGVQSSALEKLGRRGAFGAKPRFSIFADTKHEPKSVYAWLEKIKSESDLPLIEVSRGDLAHDAIVVKQSRKTGRFWMKGLIPAFLLNADGSKGLMGRKCTEDYKIIPIQQQLRKIVGRDAMVAWRKKHRTALAELRDWTEAVKVSRKNRMPLPFRPQLAWDECQSDPLIIQWIGISTDEADRAKDSRVPWIKARWPLLEQEMSRTHCAKTVPGAPRSACKFCPFHSDVEWQRLKKEEPEEFEQAVAFEGQLQDAASRQQSLVGIPFLHDSCRPLSEIDFDCNDSKSHKQLSLWTNECEGMCGV